jgi:hypothetical protein
MATYRDLENLLRREGVPESMQSEVVSAVLEKVSLNRCYDVTLDGIRKMLSVLKDDEAHDKVISALLDYNRNNLLQFYEFVPDAWQYVEEHRYDPECRTLEDVMRKGHRKGYKLAWNWLELKLDAFDDVVRGMLDNQG